MDQETAKMIADKGEKIYAEYIKPSLDLEKETGNFVVIDVNSGEYEIHKRDPVATRRLLERHPGAVTYAVRVGRPTAYRMTGIKMVRPARC